VAKTRPWVEQQVEGIISALGVQRAGTRPVKKGRRDATDVKGPGGGDGGYGIHDGQAKDDESE
jgi:hypothetical protein